MTDEGRVDEYSGVEISSASDGRSVDCANASGMWHTQTNADNAIDSGDLLPNGSYLKIVADWKCSA